MIVAENAAKDILERYAVIRPSGAVAGNADEAAAIAERLGGAVVVKALVPTGGRGKAGGVRLCQSANEARLAAEGLLSTELLGHRVCRVLVEAAVPTARELYVGVVVNTATNAIDLIVGRAGGIDVEETAQHDRTSLLHLAVEPGDVLPVHRLQRWLAPLVDDGIDVPLLGHTMACLYRAAADVDALLLEVNPLAVTQEGAYVALDCKLEVDDSALVRHPSLLRLYEESLDARAARARQLGVSFVPLDGQVAIIASGAGLGMATMDLLVREGLRPANFLDTGGGISESQVRGALELVMEPDHVRGAIVNLYGGINRMLEAAKGVVSALETIGDRRPLVVKIVGNQQEEAWALLEGLPNVDVVRTPETEVAVKALAARLAAL